MRSARLSQEAAAPQHSAATTAASVRPLRAIIQAVGPSQQIFLWPVRAGRRLFSKLPDGRLQQRCGGGTRRSWSRAHRSVRALF
jgi:hypothetical protein